MPTQYLLGNDLDSMYLYLYFFFAKGQPILLKILVPEKEPKNVKWAYLSDILELYHPDLKSYVFSFYQLDVCEKAT